MPLTSIQISQIEALLPLHPIGRIAFRDPEELLKALSFIMFNEKKVLENAIDLIDDEPCLLTCIQCSNYQRFLWRVPSKKHTYICLGESHLLFRSLCIDQSLEFYCPCKSFFEQTRFSSHKVVCKHLLALRLAHHLQRIRIEVVPNEVFIDMMSADTRQP